MADDDDDDNDNDDDGGGGDVTAVNNDGHDGLGPVVTYE